MVKASSIVLLLILAFQAFASQQKSSNKCKENCDVPYVPNIFWTTEYGPAAADIGLAISNFLTCESKNYALCAHSGPATAPASQTSTANPVLPCTLSEDDPNFASCRCYVETGTSYVVINGIGNTEAYIETVRVCGVDGAKCRNMASDAIAKLASQMGIAQQELPVAPVCSYLETQAGGTVPMAPGAELISTFSLKESQNYEAAKTSCTADQGPYAGCMTASCTFELDKNGEQTGYANCRCPTYKGPYTVAMADYPCDLGDNYIWSSAYSPEN